MKQLLIFALILALGVFTAPAFLSADDDDGGGSIFDKPGEEEPEEEPEPEPRTFDFKDYKLQMETEDGRWWKELEISDENKDKGVVLSLIFKLPKSNDHFDARMFCQAWEHGGNLQFNDGTKISTASAGQLADKYFELDSTDWKEVRDPEKPKKRRLSREIKSCYRYALTGLSGGSYPLRKEAYYFTHAGKTYRLEILFTTTSMKNERITEDVARMLKSIKEKKRRR